MARSHATLIFAAALVVNVLLLSQSRLTDVALQRYDGQDFKAGVSLFRKGLFATESEGSGETVRVRITVPFGICHLLNARIVLVPPGCCVWRRTRFRITSVGPPRCPSRSNASTSKKNVQARIPSSPSLIPNGTSALDKKPDRGPLWASPSGSYSFSRPSV